MLFDTLCGCIVSFDGDVVHLSSASNTPCIYLICILGKYRSGIIWIRRIYCSSLLSLLLTMLFCAPKSFIILHCCWNVVGCSSCVDCSLWAAAVGLLHQLQFEKSAGHFTSRLWRIFIPIASWGVSLWEWIGFQGSRVGAKHGSFGMLVKWLYGSLVLLLLFKACQVFT